MEPTETMSIWVEIDLNYWHCPNQKLMTWPETQKFTGEAVRLSESLIPKSASWPNCGWGCFSLFCIITSVWRMWSQDALLMSPSFLHSCVSWAGSNHQIKRCLFLLKFHWHEMESNLFPLIHQYKCSLMSEDKATWIYCHCHLVTFSRREARTIESSFLWKLPSGLTWIKSFSSIGVFCPQKLKS